MTIEQGKELLQPFIEEATKDKDVFLLVHFSSQEDKYNGMDEGLDALDAMIIIKQLVKNFNIDKTLLSTCYQSAKYSV